MKVIGIVGLIGSGKDTASSYIEKKYGYVPVSYSEIVHEKTREDGLEATRENLQKTAKKYREKYGMDYFAKLVVKKALSLKADKLLLKEMRRKEDAEVPKKQFGKNIFIIEIEAKPEIRFERLKKRASVRDPKTWEEFIEQEKREEELGFSGAMKLADFKIKNNGSIEELFSKVDEVMKKVEKE